MLGNFPWVTRPSFGIITLDLDAKNYIYAMSYCILFIQLIKIVERSFFLFCSFSFLGGLYIDSEAKILYTIYKNINMTSAAFLVLS
jgi:hypothetical protein